MNKKNKKDIDENKVEDSDLDVQGQKVEEESESVSKEEFDGLKERFDELQNQLKRAVADYQNLERRVSEGRQEFASWANTELIKKLLTVLDHYEKALSGASEEDKKSGWFRGVELATQQFQNVLKDEGLEQIVADGQFDPSLHEAVDMREPTDAEAVAGKGEDNSILEVVEKGYNLNGKVVKPVKVVVGKKGT